MNNEIKQKLEYYISPIVLDIIRLVINIASSPFIKNVIKTNKKWENKYNGESVYVIANGPSLSMIDKKIYEGKKVIVMNSFQKADWKNSVEIVAHCIGEPYGAVAWVEEDILESIDGTNSKSYWLHYSSYKKIRSIGKDNFIHYVFLPYESGLWLKNYIRLHKSTLAYQTTAQLAIQVALYMGFKKIYLLGFDHDWLASPKYSKHFYSNSKDSTDTIGDMRYIDIIKLMERMWTIYYKLADISSSLGAKIYNLSPNSYLDIFELKSYGSLNNLVE